jgi:hypothetical protein
MPVTIVAKVNSAGVINTQNPVTIKNTPTVMTGNAHLRVEELTNVVANNEVDGGTLVYNANTGTWSVQPITVTYFDGGSF